MAAPPDADICSLNFTQKPPGMATFEDVFNVEKLPNSPSLMPTLCLGLCQIQIKFDVKLTELGSRSVFQGSLTTRSLFFNGLLLINCS